jgi:hypothetical protein
MTTTIETAPPFSELRREFGFPIAYRKWQELHRAEERILVGPWDNDVFYKVHEEVKRRYQAQRLPYNGHPNNSEYEVTPTGGRLIRCQYIDPVLGPPTPIDPPADELLRLYWILAYWETRHEDDVRQFAKLKTQLKVAANHKRRDPQRLAELKRLQQLAKQSKAEVEAVNEKLQPIQPRGLREPTPEELAIVQSRLDSEAAFDRELDRIEL